VNISSLTLTPFCGTTLPIFPSVENRLPCGEAFSTYNIIVQWWPVAAAYAAPLPQPAPSPAILPLASSPLPVSARAVYFLRVVPLTRRLLHPSPAPTPRNRAARCMVRPLLPLHHVRSPQHRAAHLSRHRALSNPPAQPWQPSSPFPSIQFELVN
jgi:hypothetical protein